MLKPQKRVKDVAQLVEHWVWIGANTVSTPRCGEGFFSQESTVSADSLVVFVQPPCVVAYIHICARMKNHKYCQPYHCLDMQKYSTN